MSYSGRIVTARPPSERQIPVRVASPGAGPTQLTGKPVPDAVAPNTSAAVLAAFHKLLASWLQHRHGACLPIWATRLYLTDDQAVRVTHLIAIDATMKQIGGQPIGIWMTTGNIAPVLSGSSPMAYLTRRGQTAYATLLRQVERWAAM